jgi:hypothetical protein
MLAIMFESIGSLDSYDSCLVFDILRIISSLRPLYKAGEDFYASVFCPRYSFCKKGAKASVEAVAMSSAHMHILIILSWYVQGIFALSASFLDRASSQLNSSAKLGAAGPNDVGL